MPQETSPDLEFPVPENTVLEEAEETAGLTIGTVDTPDRDNIELEAENRLGAGGLWQAMQINSQTEAVFQTSEDGDY
ncbi:hypothetical protein [Pelagibacterium sp.]|uniref:hypothetical protein n=1 Tax=Pelagibacterium sp. TaxID=1967288 RepID=UPI003A938145